MPFRPSGDMALFVWNTFYWLLSRRPRRGTLLPILYQVGVLSLPVVALTGTFIGMVLAVQSFFQFQQLRMETRLGAVINMTLARELGPVLAATMLAGRVGSAMAAELGTMRVTEQIDALSSMGTNPVHYLVVPRFLAFVLLIPALTVMAVFMGVVGGYFYSVVILGIDKHHYLVQHAGVCRQLGPVLWGAEEHLLRDCHVAWSAAIRGSIVRRGGRRRQSGDGGLRAFLCVDLGAGPVARDQPGYHLLRALARRVQSLLISDTSL
jgi:ABC transport permease subunit